jgi:hypothetical protein
VLLEPAKLQVVSPTTVQQMLATAAIPSGWYLAAVQADAQQQ